MFRLKTVVFCLFLSLSIGVFSQVDKNITYKRSIKVADSIYATGDLEGARGAYFYASRLMPENSYPTQQIAKIAKQLSESVNSRVEFEKVVNQANKLLADGDKISAKAKFEEALTIMEEPKTRAILDKINADIAEAKAIKLAYDKNMELANKELLAGNYYEAVQIFNKAAEIKKDEKGPANEIKNIQLRLVEEYGIHDTIVAKGDQFYDAKEFRKALFMYKTALILMPDNKATKGKYGELDNIVDYYTELKTQFDKAVQDGDKAMALKNFKVAESSFKIAIDIFPDEKYPNEQLKTAQQMSFNYANLDKLFKESITNGDALLMTGNLEKALEQYLAAENLKTNQAKTKVTAVEKRIATIQLLTEQYSKYLITADTLFNARRFEDALATYRSALALKDKEIEIRKGSSKAIDESLCLITTTYPQKRVKEIEEVIAVSSRSFNSKKDAADKEFANRNLDMAKRIYEEVLLIRPQDRYTIGQIETIITMQKADIEKANADYESTISLANQLIASEQYTEAITNLELAKAMRPENIELDNRIAEVKTLLSSANEREAKFNELMTDASAAFTAKNLLSAKSKYEEALKYKPNNALAVGRINTINERFELLKNIEKNYANAIQQGDTYFDNKDYEAALKQYSDAIALKPDEKYPSERLKTTQAELDILEKINNEYNLYAKEADALFEAEQYNDAISKYTQAKLIKPKETYPTSQIALVENAIKEVARKAEQERLASVIETDEKAAKLMENPIRTLGNGQINLTKGSNTRLNFKAIQKNARENSVLVIKAENMSAENNVRIVLNFGLGYTLQGGVVVNMLAEKGSHYYIIDIANESNWVNKDNDWITLLSENGNISINEIKIVDKAQ